MGKKRLQVGVERFVGLIVRLRKSESWVGRGLVWPTQTASLSLPPILPKAQKMPAAIIYCTFFAVGVLSGTMLTGGKKGGASSKTKTQK